MAKNFNQNILYSKKLSIQYQSFNIPKKINRFIVVSYYILTSLSLPFFILPLTLTMPNHLVGICFLYSNMTKPIFAICETTSMIKKGQKGERGTRHS